MSLFAYAQNFLSESLVVPSSMVPVTHMPYVERYAVGSAVLEVQGEFSDVRNRDYVLFISYADTGTGTFRYDWSDEGGTTWNAVDVTVVPNVWQNLSYGVQIRFLAGTFSPQLVYADRFRFHVERPYRPALCLDGTRDQEMRSGAITAGNTYTVTFPFGVATVPKALIIFDHNILTGSTIRLQASTTSNFAATPYNEIVPWASQKIAFRTTGNPSYAYWRLQVTTISDVAFMAISGLYLGGELAFLKEFDIGFRKTLSLMGGSDLDRLARGQGRYGLQPERYEVSFRGRTTADDLAVLQSLWTLTHPTGGSSQRPFYLYMDSVASLPIFELFHIEGDMPQTHEVLDRLSPQLNLVQVVRSAA